MIKTCRRVECSAAFTTNDNRKCYCSRSCAVSVNNVLYPKRKSANPRLPAKPLIEKWIDGEWDGTTKEGLSSTVRRYLIELGNRECWECGWSGTNPVSGKTTLQVEHIDGNCMNNTRENLKVLCPNCHSLTPTYGALNKGNGRSFRYMR